MKTTKKVLAFLSACTTLLCSALPVFAETADESGKYDFTVQLDRTAYNCYLDDNNDCPMRVPDGISYESVTNFNGIVFETNGDVDVSKLDLKYEFTNSDIFSYYTANIHLGHNQSYVENIYSCQINGDLSELEAYANEISKMEGIKYAEVFNIDVEELGALINTSKDDCCIFINGGEDREEYMNELNNNKEFIEYLTAISADPEVKIYEDEPLLYVSKINDRTKYFDIVKKLRSLEYIGNNSVILATIPVDNANITFDFIGRDYSGDANEDKYINVRDCAAIASMLAKGKGSSLPETADYNKDGKKDVRDAAAIAVELSK